MEVWAHTLVKNEARWLWYSVTSVIDHVDKLLLWDTGSTDGSLEIESELAKKFPEKIELRARTISIKEDFALARQEMLNETRSDWFIVVDGDEIWWDESIKKVCNFIKKEGNKYESIVVPTINLVGDIFHYQEKEAGKYKFGSRVGHYNLRAVNMKIPGLHSEGSHGVWGWTDGEGKMIQDRKSYKFIDAPYLHATNLPRSSKDREVMKRAKKLRFEIGETFPKDFYYPESLFGDAPGIIESPWQVMPLNFKIRAYLETPLRKVKRRLWQGSPGY